MKTLFPYVLIGIISLALTSCGDIIPLWVGEAELNDYTLYYTDKPLEFNINIDPLNQDTLRTRLELEITYYTEIGRTDIPIFLVLEDSKNNVSEYNTNITIKADGEWLGYPRNNEMDYTITHNAIDDLEINGGQYLLRVYANDEDQEKIYGIINVVARLYEKEILPES